MLFLVKNRGLSSWCTSTRWCHWLLKSVCIWIRLSKFMQVALSHLCNFTCRSTSLSHLIVCNPWSTIWLWYLTVRRSNIWIIIVLCWTRWISWYQWTLVTWYIAVILILILCKWIWRSILMNVIALSLGRGVIMDCWIITHITSIYSMLSVGTTSWHITTFFMNLRVAVEIWRWIRIISLRMSSIVWRRILRAKFIAMTYNFFGLIVISWMLLCWFLLSVIKSIRPKKNLIPTFIVVIITIRLLLLLLLLSWVKPRITAVSSPQNHW
jgi:hypothetical protein